MIAACVAGIPDYGGWRADTSALFSSTYGTRHTYGSEAKTVIGLCELTMDECRCPTLNALAAREDGSLDTHHIQALRDRLREISENLRLRKKRYTVEELRPVLYRAAAVIMAKAELDYGLLREIVFIPVHAVNPSAMHLGVEVWAWLVDRRADVEQKLMVDLHLAWSWTVRRRRGLFSVLLRYAGATEQPRVRLTHDVTGRRTRSTPRPNTPLLISQLYQRHREQSRRCSHRIATSWASFRAGFRRTVIGTES